MADYYEILGVPRNASARPTCARRTRLKAREQRAKLALQLHRKKGGEKESTEITAAFNALADASRPAAAGRRVSTRRSQRPPQATPEAITPPPLSAGGPWIGSSTGRSTRRWSCCARPCSSRPGRAPLPRGAGPGARPDAEAVDITRASSPGFSNERSSSSRRRRSRPCPGRGPAPGAGPPAAGAPWHAGVGPAAWTPRGGPQRSRVLEATGPDDPGPGDGGGVATSSSL